MWEQMWHEVHDVKTQMAHFSLADPPAVKELLRSEVQLLLLSLRQRAATLGRWGEIPLGTIVTSTQSDCYAKVPNSCKEKATPPHSVPLCVLLSYEVNHNLCSSQLIWIWSNISTVTRSYSKAKSLQNYSHVSEVKEGLLNFPFLFFFFLVSYHQKTYRWIGYKVMSL